LERLQPGVQASLLLVQQAEVQDDPRPEIIRHYLPAENAPAQAGLRFLQSPNRYLMLPNLRVRRTVEVSPRYLLTANPTATKQIQERCLRLYVKHVIQLLREAPCFRAGHESLTRLHQRAVTRKPHRTERPQTQVVEQSDLVQRVVPTPVRVARPVTEFLELPEHRDIHLRSES